VRDVTTSNTTDEAYGADGALLWRYTGSSSDPNQRAFVPLGGCILAEYYSGGTIFDHPDEIGSATTSSDYTGSNFNEKLFYPFGELWTGAAIPNLNMHQTFAQLPDYDSETDQYNTPNRHYNPTGRWLSPDPGGLKVVRLDDPQTWNMYAYARNNPTTVTDPSGLITPELNGDRHSGGADSYSFTGCSDTTPCGDDPAVITAPKNLSWSSLTLAQQAVLQGGEKAWDDMSPAQQANFAAITHALETIDLGNGATGLSEIQAGSASMRSSGHEMDVTWKDGAAKAFESHGFSSRPGEHEGTNLGPTGMGIQGLHLIFGKKENQVHIDYRGLFEGHYKPYNDDVTARPGPQRTPHGRLINNAERYREWYP
jgi:RHS repeat-associated protein